MNSDMTYPITCLHCWPISTLHYYSQYISCKEEFVVIIHKLMIGDRCYRQTVHMLYCKSNTISQMMCSICFTQLLHKHSLPCLICHSSFLHNTFLVGLPRLSFKKTYWGSSSLRSQIFHHTLRQWRHIHCVWLHPLECLCVAPLEWT